MSYNNEPTISRPYRYKSTTHIVLEEMAKKSKEKSLNKLVSKILDNAADEYRKATLKKKMAKSNKPVKKSIKVQ